MKDPYGPWYIPRVQPPAPGVVKVIHGCHDQTFAVAGRSVETIRRSLQEVFNISPEAKSLVNGYEVAFSHLLGAGEVLEFVRGWCWKGAGKPWGRDHLLCDPDDYYPTPPHATRALLEQENFGRTVWEPACGDGAISKVLKQAGYRVISSDLVDRGYGLVQNFLASRRMVESIVTNPPYSLAEEFVHHAMRSTTNKVALLLRLSFLESQGRYELFQETPLKAVYVFSRRLTLHRGGVVGHSGAVAYAWFVWQHGYRGEPRLRWFAPDAGL
jgi:hypothetical protein